MTNTKLTHRENQIMQHMAKGKENSEIATELGISKSTTENHIHSVYIKLNVKNRVQAINKWRKD